MKGLILASLDRRNEGLEMAKQGLRYDLTSFISWHALGILNRIVKNYNESIKCYAQALKIEGGSNVNLVRESAYLYMQLRDWAKVVEHRATLLRMQPHLRMNWVGLAAALHLGGDAAESLRVLEQFESVHRDVPKRSFEQSEVFLYHAQVLHEAGRHKDAIEYLAAKGSDEVLDVKALALLQGQCQLALDRREEAQATFQSLLERNDEDRNYIALWLKAKGIDVHAAKTVDRAQADEAFKQLQSSFPKSRAIKRMGLVYATGADFRDQAEAYITVALQKGVPSIFNDVRALYVDDAKRLAIEAIVEDARERWSKEAMEAPTSLLWALYFLAQHYNHLGQHALALQYIHSAIAHTPTLPEVHMTRARIYKKAGALLWASQAMEDARLLDGQDRSLNCKAAKYLLRIGEIAGASANAGMFTKPDAPNPASDLVEMQATWYLIEEAHSWLTKGNYAMALKRCTQIDRIYTEIWDDQMDFHSYCTRKFTLRAYVNMVRFEDRLHQHQAYFAAATTAIKIFLTLHDSPSLYKPQNGVANGHLTEEQKKEAKKARKQELRAAAEEAAKKTKTPAAKTEKKADDDETTGPPKDEDPEGKEALKAVEPLKDAERYLEVLQRHASSRIDTWLLSFEVALRGHDWLAATKALARAHALEPDNADLHVALVQLRLGLPKLDEAPEPVRDSIKAVLSPIVPMDDASLEAFRAGYVQRNAMRGDGALAAARSLVLIRGTKDETGKREAAALLVDMAQQVNAGQVKCSLSTLQAGLVFLQGQGPAVEQDLASYVQAAHLAYPLADTFKSDAQKEQEAIDRQNERLSWAFAPSDAAASVETAAKEQSNGK